MVCVGAGVGAVVVAAAAAGASAGAAAAAFNAAGNGIYPKINQNQFFLYNSKIAKK